MSRMRKEWDQHREFYERLSSTLTEVFANIKVVKSFAAEKKEVKKYDKMLEEERKMHNRTSFFNIHKLKHMVETFSYMA